MWKCWTCSTVVRLCDDGLAVIANKINIMQPCFECLTVTDIQGPVCACEFSEFCFGLFDFQLIN